MGVIKKDQDFWNITTWNVRGLTGKENELVRERKSGYVRNLGYKKERFGRN